MALLPRLAALLVVIAWAGILSPYAMAADGQPPILFVHGAGDDATVWYTVFWRFETNGYDPHGCSPSTSPIRSQPAPKTMANHIRGDRPQPSS